MVAALGGLVGLGAGTAFLGRAVVVVGGGGGLGFWVGGSPRRRFRQTTRKKTFLLVWRVGGGWASLGGAFWGGGGGRLPPSPPSSISLTPPPPMFHHISSSSPPAYPTSCIRAHSAGRKWRGATHMPLTTREVSQLRRPRKRARPKGGSRATMRWGNPRGTSWDPSASRQATRIGLSFVALTTTSIT